MNIEKADCLVINAPEWFLYKPFVDYLNRLRNPKGERRIATWHRGGEPNEYSDVFLVYDHHEGSDIFQEPGLLHIWQHICEEADRVGMTYGTVWIKNIAEE